MFTLIRTSYRSGLRSLVVGALSLVLLLPGIASAAPSLNLLKATPIGSWSLREEITTDHKGRQTVSVMRSSMLSKEERNGKTYYWIEMVMDSFKVKKGKRKPADDRAVIKILVAEDMFTGDPANAMRNLRGVGEEMIVQSGKNKPMRMSGAGGFAQGMMKGMGTEVTYDFEDQGSEKVTVQAGSFDTRKLQGSGSVSMKVLFKKINVTSNTTSYYSENVPFGIVKVNGDSTINGKVSQNTSELLEYGTSGATSLITETPEEMPAMPNMKDLFGGGKG
ncbi:MAG: hypothetical protein AB8B86_02680 [Pseudomonadales bacterium]